MKKSFSQFLGGRSFTSLVEGEFVVTLRARKFLA